MPTELRTNEESDLFDMKPALLRLEQAEKWLTEAMELVKVGTTESLLRYFQTGYTSGNWHFPTITTHYCHGIGHRLARLLQEELLEGTHFHFDYPKLSYQSFHIYYSEGETRGRLIGRIAIWTREIDLSLHFGDSEERLKRLIANEEESISKHEKWLAKNEQWFSKYQNKIWIRLFERYKESRIISWWYKDRLVEMRNILSDRRSLIQSSRDRIKDYQKDIERLHAIEGEMSVLERFKKYGFTINPARSDAELEADGAEEDD